MPEPEIEPAEGLPAETPSNWEFLGRAPTQQEVRDLLATLPPVWGVSVSAFEEYVQGLPQNKKFKVPHPTNPKLVVDQRLEAFTLYMSVGGRQQMLRAAQELHGWRVDYRPEPVTPSGVPGYLSFAERLVYRVYVDVYERYAPDPECRAIESFRAERLLGTRSGTAWVPASGGSNAAGSNPYEKVETSALGRAIGAWGFGVLPGSGIATVEEMAAIAGNRQHLEAQGTERGSRQSREELLESTLSLVEQYRQEAGKDDEAMTAQIAAYLSERLGIQGVFDSVKRKILWDAVKDGQLVMLRSSMQDGIKRLRDAQFGV